MRRNIIGVMICLLLPCTVLAGHLDLSWDANTENDLAGYILYYGTSSQSYTNSIDVGQESSAHVTGLIDDTEYFFAVTAYDHSGNESAFSEEISGYAIPGESSISETGSGGSSSGGGCFITKTLPIS